MDTITGAPMEKLLKDLPLNDEICHALMGYENPYKKVLDLVIAVEKGEWSTVTETCKTIQFDENQLFTIYTDSLSWANMLISREKKNVNKQWTGQCTIILFVFFLVKHFK